MSKFIEPAQSLVEQLQVAFEDFCRFLSASGTYFRPYDENRQMQGIEALPAERQREILDRFRRYSVVCEAFEKESFNSRTFVWRMLQGLSLRPTHDLFERIQEDDCVEIYDAQGVQVASSLSFFKYCSYSLADLQEFPWWFLFQRDVEVQNAAMELGRRALAGELDSTVLGSIPRHTVKEVSCVDGISSERGYCATIEHKFVSPIRAKDGSRGGFVHCFRVDTIAPTRGVPNRPHLRRDRDHLESPQVEKIFRSSFD